MLTANDFAELYAAQGPRLLRAARLMLAYDYHRPDAAGEAQDLTQDVWTRLWERWPALDELPTPGYLFTATKHAMIDLYRRRRLIRWHSLDAPPAGCDRDEPGDWLRDPRDRIGAVDARLDLAAGLGLLTATERRAFVAFHVRDEAGQDTGQSKMARMRARRRLRQCAPLAGYAPACTPLRPRLAS